DLPRGEAMRRGLERTLDLLAKHHKDVWLLLQVPELPFNPTECVPRPFSFEHRARMPCAVSRSTVLDQQRAYRNVVRQMQDEFPWLRVFDPVPIICDAVWCPAMEGSRLLYRDDHHLSRDGSHFFA